MLDDSKVYAVKSAAVIKLSGLQPVLFCGKQRGHHLIRCKMNASFLEDAMQLLKLLWVVVAHPHSFDLLALQSLSQPIR